MRYKIIVGDNEEELQKLVNVFYNQQEAVCQQVNHARPNFVFIGPPTQVQCGPELFRMAQAFTY